MKKTFTLFSLFANLCLLAALSKNPQTELKNQSPVPSFTENKGQVSDQYNQRRPDVLYSGVINGNVFHLRNNGISYQLKRTDSWREEENKYLEKIKLPNQTTIYRLDVNWLNSNANFELINDEALSGYTNYYLPSCPKGLHRVKTYTGVTYKNIYNNIDLHYYEKDGALKYDYFVAAGADHNQIQIELKGAEKISIDKNGNVIFKTPLGNIAEHAPLVIQKGKALVSKWILKNNVLSFHIDGIDHTQPFVIDPAVRVWGTYYGGFLTDWGYSCTTFGTTDVYLAGSTLSNGGTVIATTGGHQTIYNGFYTNAFLAKFDISGVRQWGTYYAGDNGAQGSCCITDASGNVYLAGYANTTSGSEIATPGSHQPLNNGNLDAFLVKFDSAGVRQWGTFYGGAAGEIGSACATDNNGNIYLSGNTSSSTDIATAGSHQSITASMYEAFLVKFNSAGVRLWGTYYGGAGGANSFDCATDNNGNIILCGLSSGTDVASAGCHQPNFGGGQGDAYIAKFDSSGTRQWGTLYGGTGSENGYACCMDLNGNVFLTGNTDSYLTGTAIATLGSHQPSYGGGTYDAFLVKFNSAGVRQWGTYYGGLAYDQTFSCVTDANGNLFLAGETGSSNGTTIATPGSHQPTYGNGQQSAILVKFNGSGIRQWGTYYGFLAYGNGRSCATNNIGNIYFAGFAGGPSSTTLVATPNGHQPIYGGDTYDAFLAHFYECPAPDVMATSSSSVICAGTTVTLSASGATSYTWSTGSNSPIISVGPTGITNYTLVGSDGSACNDTTIIKIIVDVCTGVDQLINSSFISVYPNPNNGEFIVKSEWPMEMLVYDILGELIVKQQLTIGKNHIDLAQQPKGTYTMKLSSSETTKTIKIIKE